MKDIPFEQYAEQTLTQLHGPGIFLTTRFEDRTNIMTIGWGSLSVYWGKPVFIAPVRHSRFSHSLLEGSGVFTVTVPKGTTLNKALGYCGTRSGREGDKFAACGLTAVPGRMVDCPVIGEGWLHYECRVVASTVLNAGDLAPEIDQSAYRDHDYHTLYFGEILALYETP